MSDNSDFARLVRRREPAASARVALGESGPFPPEARTCLRRPWAVGGRRGRLRAACRSARASGPASACSEEATWPCALGAAAARPLPLSCAQCGASALVMWRGPGLPSGCCVRRATGPVCCSPRRRVASPAAHYEGFLDDGSMFDSSRERGTEFKVGFRAALRPRRRAGLPCAPSSGTSAFPSAAHTLTSADAPVSAPAPPPH